MKKFMFFLICIPCFFYNTLFAQQWSGTSTPSSTISRTGEVGVGLSSATWSGATSSSTRQMLTVDAGTTGYATSYAARFINRLSSSNTGTGNFNIDVGIGSLSGYHANSFGNAIYGNMNINSLDNPYSTSWSGTGGGSFSCNLANNISNTNGFIGIYGLSASLGANNPAAITTFPTNGYMAAFVVNDGINKTGTRAILSDGKVQFRGLPTSDTNNLIWTSDPAGNVFLRDAATLGAIYAAGNGISINNGTIENTGDISLVGHDLILSSDATSVDLSPYMQTLSITGNVISLTNGGSVTLPAAPVYTAGTGISMIGNVISNTIPSYFTANGANIYNNNSGNVGIGTNTPTSKLHISSTAVANTAETLTKYNVSDAPNDVMEIKNASPTNLSFSPMLRAYVASSSTIPSLAFSGEVASIRDVGTTPLVSFVARTSSGVVATRPLFSWKNYTNAAAMTMLANGNLGIGTITPTAQLHTTGTVAFSGVPNTGNSNTKFLTGDANGNLAWRDASTLGSNYTAGNGITITNNVISSNLVSSQWLPSSTSTNVTPNGNIITYDGRIAVGELCTGANFNKYPSNYSGYFGNAGILASGLRIANICDQINWADFVFGKNYHLPSLKSEKEYIEKNGHLRDVPSAKEIAEKGIDVAEMFKLQMQKIEELTLHAIALSEKLDKLQAENEALKVKLEK